MTSDEKNIPFSEEECLARFITDSDWIRSDGSIRQEAFAPPRDLQFSVTRHLNLSTDALWAAGRLVVEQLRRVQPSAVLGGRADVTVSSVRQNNLLVEAAPLPENPNHAHIVGWPADKPARKIISLELAKAALVSRYP